MATLGHQRQASRLGKGDKRIFRLSLVLVYWLLIVFICTVFLQFRQFRITSTTTTAAARLAAATLVEERAVDNSMTTKATRKKSIEETLESNSNTAAIHHHHHQQQQQQPEWCSGGSNLTKPAFLAAVLGVRLRDDDPAQLLSDDLKHWIWYYRYAGVDRIYVYDAWQDVKEKIVDLPEDMAVYRDWHQVAMSNLDSKGNRKRTHISAVQAPAYQHCTRGLTDVEWMIFTDMDEYPFLHNDTRPGFLARYLKAVPDSISQVVMPNYLVEGPRLRELGPALIQQVPRVHTKAVNNLVKQIARVRHCKHHDVHWSKCQGDKLKTHDLVMRHVWGARRYDFRSNLTAAEHDELWKETKDTHDWKHMADAILQCTRSSYA